MRTASVTPKVAASFFPPPEPESTSPPGLPRPTSNISKRRTETTSASLRSVDDKDEFDDGIDDDELVKAAIDDLDFDHIDNYLNPTDEITRKNTAKNGSMKNKSRIQERSILLERADKEARQLPNGKWACNHPCKDKDACKHLCCKQGMDKPPKKPISKQNLSTESNNNSYDRISEDKGKTNQTKLQLKFSKRKSSAAVEELDLTQQERKKKVNHGANGLGDYEKLDKLHKSIQKTIPLSTISTITHQKPSYCYSQAGPPKLSFLEKHSSAGRPSSSRSSDYGELAFGDLPADMAITGPKPTHTAPKATDISMEGKSDPATELQDQTYDNFDEDLMLEDISFDVADSEDHRKTVKVHDEHLQRFGTSVYEDPDLDYLDNTPGLCGIASGNDAEDHEADNMLQDGPASSTVSIPMLPPKKGQSLFLNDTSSPQISQTDFKSARSMLERSASKEFELGAQYHPQRATELDSHKVTETAVEKSEPDALTQESIATTKAPVPNAYNDLEPWLFQEFGDIVEVVD